MTHYVTERQETTICDRRPVTGYDGRPQTATDLPSLHFHMVFYAAEGAIGAAWRDKFYRFLGGCLCAAGATGEAIGGTQDRLHLLVSLNLGTAPSDFARRIKLLSECWARREAAAAAAARSGFAWRAEFDAFTVSRADIETVKN